MEDVKSVLQGNQRTYDRELEVSLAPLVDINNPPLVRPEVVSREANYFDITPLEIGSTARDFSELGCADRSKVIGMRKKNGLL
jgi:hypothetical protein